jgi:hypothetical protein
MRTREKMIPRRRSRTTQKRRKRAVEKDAEGVEKEK